MRSRCTNMYSCDVFSVRVQACIAILQDAGTSQSAALHCAHILRNKVRRQYQTLPEGSLPGFRDALVGCINSFSTLLPVALQLCIALSALVLHWTDWEDVLAHLGKHSTKHPGSLLVLQLQLQHAISRMTALQGRG